MERYDNTFANFKNVIRDKEAEISDLKIEISEVRGQLNTQNSRGSEQEAFFNEKLKEMRLQLENSHWTKDEELRKAREAAEEMKRELNRQLRVKVLQLVVLTQESNGTTIFC